MKWRLAFAPLLICLGGCDSRDPDANMLALPPGLREISDVAPATPTSVFAHDDMHAIVYEIDIAEKRVLRVFALGDPTIAGDFEGIAFVDGRVHLATSDGRIFTARPGQNRQRVAYNRHDTGLGRICEVEGLSAAPAGGGLLLLCKRRHRRKGEARLEIFAWSPAVPQAAPVPWLAVPLSRLLGAKERADFRPSGFTWDAPRNRLIIVSGRNRMFLMIDPQGRLLGKRRLDARRHHKTEGVAILPPCRLVLADEGGRKHKGTLSVYPCSA